MADVHVLRFLNGNHEGQEFPLMPDESYIAGRSTEADIALSDDTVSRKHARFHHERGRLWVRDLGSRNGTVVNGQAVPYYVLDQGDRVAIGAFFMRVDLVPASKVSQPAPSPEETSSGRSMSGTLADIPLADVLQWLSTSRKTGMLRVRGKRQGSLFLRSGSVYYASIDDAASLNPEKALLRMLSWQDGTFGLDNATPDEEAMVGEISTPLEHLLMEAARQTDELNHLAQRKGIPEEEVTLVLPSPTPWKELEPEGLDIVQRLVEGLSWTSILDTSEMDDVAVTKAVVALKAKGVVEY